MRDGLPRLVIQRDDAEVAHLLRELQLLVLRHPVAARALFGALRAEGRAFRETPRGRTWAAALAASPVVAQARAVFDASTLGALDGDAPEVLPGALVDALAQAGTTGDPEALLAQVFALGSTP